MQGMSLLDRILDITYGRKIFNVIRDPSSFYAVFVLIAQLTTLISFSLLVPFAIRYLILPSSVQNEIPLNLIFMPCSDDLHGICSFPTATLDLRQFPVFSPNIYYSMNLRLHFAPIDTNKKIGLFQNVISLYGQEGEKIRDWHRSTYLKEPGIITKSMWIAFFPLYFMGWFSDYNVIEIPMASEYYASASQTASRLVYILQDRYAQVDSAYLLVHAQFGLIRHLVYYWPISTYILLTVCTFGGFCFCWLLLLGGRSFLVARTNQRRASQAVIPPAAPSTSPRCQMNSPIKQASPSADEFIPENVDEVPECATLDMIPNGTCKVRNTSPSNHLRRRKQTLL